MKLLGKKGGFADVFKGGFGKCGVQNVVFCW
jgi:hypothetical protein